MLERNGAGQLINLVRTGRALTRPALERETGLGRKVVAQRVQQAIDVGLLEDADLASSGAGRPSRVLRFRAEAGHVFVGLVSAVHVNAAVTTLDGTLVAALHEVVGRRGGSGGHHGGAGRPVRTAGA